MDLENMKTDWNNMRRGIDAQPALLEVAPAQLYEEASRVLSLVPSRLYLTGCGDSHYCGLAARYAIEGWSGIGTEPHESLEFSRYAVRTAAVDSLVIGVSNSGEVARSVESLRYAAARGIPTLAMTYKPESRLAQAADTTLRYSYEDTGFGPGTLSYTACVLGLLVTGLRLGELSGRLSRSDVKAELDALRRLSEGLAQTIAAGEDIAKRVSGDFEHDQPWFFLGAGPNLGTAHFAMAKMIESVRHNSVAQELEEWAHEQYFCCEPGTTTVVFAPPGAALGRAREQLRAISDVGGTSVVVCDVEDQETAAMADHAFPVYGSPHELVSPLLYGIPAQLLAYHVGLRSGRTMLGFDDQHRKDVNMRQILRSDIPDSLPALGGAPR